MCPGLVLVDRFELHLSSMDEELVGDGSVDDGQPVAWCLLVHTSERNASILVE